MCKEYIYTTEEVVCRCGIVVDRQEVVDEEYDFFKRQSNGSITFFNTSLSLGSYGGGKKVIKRYGHEVAIIRVLNLLVEHKIFTKVEIYEMMRAYYKRKKIQKRVIFPDHVIKFGRERGRNIEKIKDILKINYR